MTHKVVHGYKGFKPNMTCRDFQYEIGQTYEMDGEIEPCRRGFHFCQKIADVFDYYNKKDCRYAEVEAVGKVVEYGDKSVTNKIRIVRELTWAEVLEAMFVQAGMDLETSFFSADKIIQARETGALGEMLPSGTEFHVTFANGERNVLVVCRDEGHTYLVTKYIMAEPFAMNDDWTNEGGWLASEMRGYVNKKYDMLPEDIRRVIIPMHIQQVAQGDFVECDDPAFLLSAVNVFGEEEWYPENDCEDTQIDIFRNPVNRVKRRLGGSSPTAWWLRSASTYRFFTNVSDIGDRGHDFACFTLGVIIAFCIEVRDGDEN